ncbi:MAG TPA: substrate-binding domain-containing protein [Rhodanobacteraceae bacterium]|nr:substrate-binding domain-containing protein [Rhodanobacteraceae bacterium]
MSPRNLSVFFVATLLCLAGAVCNPAFAKSGHRKSSHRSESGGPPLVIRGDIITSHGLVDAIAEAWEDAGKGRIEVQPFNTVSGIDAALSGSADIAASARPGFPGRAQEAGLNFTPVAWDALVMITSPDNPVSNITLKQLHDIYWGKITNWSELGGKNEPIDLYTIASPLDGAEYSLRRLLFGRGNAPIVMPRSYINVDTLEQGIALDPKSLGLSTLSRVHDNSKVRIIPVEGVMPTPATVADGSYPLYTAIYLASSPSNPHAAQIAQFMDYLAGGEAQKLMRRHDLLPYADAPALQSPDQQLAMVTAKMVGEGLPAAQETHAEVVATAQAAPAPAAPVTPPPPASVALPTAAAPPAHIAQAADVADAKVTSSARTPKDPGVRHAEAVAPSNPVVISSGGTVTPVASVLDPSRPGDYTVDKGDTLSSIARKYSVTVADLRKWNDLKNDILRVGQVLQLRAN